MAEDGDFLTPTFLDRFLLYKPPLLIWLSALSVKFFGGSVAAIRAPALAAAIAATTLLVLWAGVSRLSGAGWICALLLLSNPLWHIFARLCYTDMLFAACIVGALYAVHSDPRLERTGSRWGFVACSAAGVLAKNVAGFLPLIVWLLVSFLTRGEARPALARAIRVCALILMLAAPWHIYQLSVHSKWFWADYVQIQLLGFGLAPPSQSGIEPQLWFYVKRVLMTDPVLIAFALLALPRFWKDLRQRRSASALLLGIWIAVIAAALMTFRYRNLPYALNLIPPLALLGAWYSPGGLWRAVPLCAAFALKAILPGAVFGLSFGATEPISSAAPLRAYAESGRPNGLIVISPDDEFYASTLPLPRVRYAMLDPDGVTVRYAPHFAYLGITVTVDQFLQLDNLSTEFRGRLRDWGLKSGDPLATAILARSPDEFARLPDARPQTDFYLPSSMLDKLSAATMESHAVIPAKNGRCFLLARQPAHVPAPPEEPPVVSSSLE